MLCGCEAAGVEVVQRLHERRRTGRGQLDQAGRGLAQRAAEQRLKEGATEAQII